MHPIAVGCSFKDLPPNVPASMPFRLSLSCCPPSTGLRYPWGGWVYLEDLPPDHAMVKVDVSKAFNSIRRDRVLRAVEEYIPSLLPLAHSSYSSPSVLMWYDTQILSVKGIQQGDPLGHMLFCLGIHKLISPLSSTSMSSTLTMAQSAGKSKTSRLIYNW